MPATNLVNRETVERHTDRYYDLDESQLTLYAKSGHREALAVLLDRYRPRLRTAVLNTVSCPHMTEDVLQETSLLVIQNIGQFRGDSGIYTWMFRIAKNACYTQLRKRSNHSMPPHQIVIQIETQQAQPEPKIYDDEATLIRKAMDRLPAKLRDVVVLRMNEEMDYRSIAERLQIELGTVRSRLSRGKAWLKEELQEKN